jgi:hypothetical protein
MPLAGWRPSVKHDLTDNDELKADYRNVNSIYNLSKQNNVSIGYLVYSFID